VQGLTCEVQFKSDVSSLSAIFCIRSCTLAPVFELSFAYAIGGINFFAMSFTSSIHGLLRGVVRSMRVVFGSCTTLECETEERAPVATKELIRVWASFIGIRYAFCCRFPMPNSCGKGCPEKSRRIYWFSCFPTRL
jgi:hypothetical protein